MLYVCNVYIRILDTRCKYPFGCINDYPEWHNRFATSGWTFQFYFVNMLQLPRIWHIGMQNLSFIVLMQTFLTLNWSVTWSEFSLCIYKSWWKTFDDIQMWKTGQEIKWTWATLDTQMYFLWTPFYELIKLFT